MDIDAKLVANLARLSRIAITAEEERMLVAQLPKIVEYVSQLQTVPAETVPVMIDQAQPLRSDQASSSKTVPAILAQAPEQKDRFWSVPAVME